MSVFVLFFFFNFRDSIWLPDRCMPYHRSHWSPDI